MLRQRGGHGLDGVVDIVEPGAGNRFAQPREALHVEGDVVVDEEDRLGAVPLRIGNIGKDPLDWVGMEVAAAHLDDRAEAAIEGAAAGRLDDVDAPSEQGVAAQHARTAIRQPQALRGERYDGRRRIVHELAAAPEREAGEARQLFRTRLAVALDRADQRTERPLAFAANEEIDRRRLVGFRRQARIVAAGDDVRRRAQRAHQMHQLQRRCALKRHDRQADDVRFFVVQQALHHAPDRRLHQHEIRDGDVVVRVDVAGQRCQRPVRHPDGDRRHVLERVGHREQQDVHER